MRGDYEKTDGIYPGCLDLKRMLSKSRQWEVVQENGGKAERRVDGKRSQWLCEVLYFQKIINNCVQSNPALSGRFLSLCLGSRPPVSDRFGGQGIRGDFWLLFVHAKSDKRNKIIDLLNNGALPQTPVHSFFRKKE
jgi:hypothetical protein